MLRFSIIQQGLIEISQKEGMKEYRPTSSLLSCGAFRAVIDTTHPKEDKREYIDAMMKLGPNLEYRTGEEHEDSQSYHRWDGLIGSIMSKISVRMRLLQAPSSRNKDPNQAAATVVF